MLHQGDLKNRNRGNKIRITDLPESVETKDLVIAAAAILNQLLLKPKDSPIEIMQIHRSLGPRNPNLVFPRDAICQIHFVLFFINLVVYFINRQTGKTR